MDDRLRKSFPLVAISPFLRSHARVNEAVKDLSYPLALRLLFLLIFSLAFMQPSIAVLGFAAVVTDLIFLGVIAAWAVLLIQRRALPIWDRAYIFIALYLLAMIASVPGSESPRVSVMKLLTQFYLASLPVVVCSLVRTEAQLRTAVRCWLAGSAVVAAVALASLVLFAAYPHSPIIEFALSVKGTLPPGNYPRLQMTFMNPNLACNCLTVSLMLLLGAHRVGWVDRGPFWVLLPALLIAAAATISPGLGGVMLGLGLWCWLTLQSRAAARLSLALGMSGAFLFVVAMTFTPILHPTAPYLIHLPHGLTLAPSGRLMIWTDGLRSFLSHPLTGRGIGIDPVSVKYLDPSGNLEISTDAHNVFLSIAGQCGAIGLAALLLLLWHMTSRTFPWRLGNDPVNVIRVAVGLGLLIGLIYEGLGGSFEDSRHLWVVFGALLASDRLSRRASSS